MRLGAVFPQVEIEPDPGAIRAYAEAVEGLGLTHLLVYDHVTAVDPLVHSDFVDAAHRAGATSARPYDVRDPFHEVMVLFGFLAGVCDLELVSGVLVLPQRQTALVAKQAAEVDILTGGRLRLGVGVGWNAWEQRSLGRTFIDRGRRIDRQIPLLRRYWTDGTVRFDGGDDWADGVGIMPRPVQRPIPLWIGAGRSRRALERVGRLGDGWLPVAVDPDEVPAQLGTVRDAAAAVGRDPDAIGIEARIEGWDGDPDRAAALATAWGSVGATHAAVNTMRCGLSGAAAHIDALERAVTAIRGR
ncbi:MAG: LLM class F420-dependent oxidoreductase [Solirubrobacteraceae bacterium]